MPRRCMKLSTTASIVGHVFMFAVVLSVHLDGDRRGSQLTILWVAREQSWRLLETS